MGEYAVRAFKQDVAKILHVGDYQSTGGDEPGCGQIILNVHNHKGDKFGERDAHVPVACNRDCTGENDPFCPVHALRRYMEWRNLMFSDSGPLFVQENGMPLLQRHVNNLVKTWIAEIGLNPDDYSSHCLRSGRATDLGRAGVLTRDIKKWGRWLSDCWERHYLKLDLSDIALATRLSLQDLKLANTNPHTVRNEHRDKIRNSCTGFNCVSRNEISKLVMDILKNANIQQTPKQNGNTTPTTTRSKSMPTIQSLLPTFAATPPKRAASAQDLSLFPSIHEATNDAMELERATVYRRKSTAKRHDDKRLTSKTTKNRKVSTKKKKSNVSKRGLQPPLLPLGARLSRGRL